jgi:hypothetical protein
VSARSDTITAVDLVLPPHGQMLPRRLRLVHNGRWHLVRAGAHQALGWGDLALADLHRLRPGLGTALFLALEEQVGGPTARAYERPGAPDGVVEDPATLVTCTLFAVGAEVGVVASDRVGSYGRGELVELPGLNEVICYVPAADIADLIKAAYAPASPPR